MRIVRCIFSPGLTGFFFDDQAAIKAGALENGFAYRGCPSTEGFETIRMAGESISVQLMLEDGSIAHGDCTAIQYSGAGGREPVFRAGRYIPWLRREVSPRIEGREIGSFRPLAEEIDRLTDQDGRLVHAAVRYGVTQALLDAAAKERHKLICEVVTEEYGLKPAYSRVPVFTQSGDERYLNADKMILKRADVLPHGLINNVATKFGTRGELLLQYVAWLKSRVAELGEDGYLPVLHLDLYGTLGLAFANDLERMAVYLGHLREAAGPHRLRIEGPLDMGNRKDQIEACAVLRRLLREKGVRVEIVADEWCNSLEDLRAFADAGAVDMVQIKTPVLGGINNTIEAVLYARSRGLGAYLGGSCNETERSAQICAQVALATQPTQILAKPGMGVDEGFSIIHNEMQRALAVLGNR